jgi:Na+/H+-dicarboxylate symporter
MINNESIQKFLLYVLMIGLGVLAGLDQIPYLKSAGLVIGEIFINCFRCISMPVIFLSLIVTFVNYRANGLMKKLWLNTLKYTLSTTLIAGSLSCVLYIIIQPRRMIASGGQHFAHVTGQGYRDYLMHLIPSNFLQPFLENQVLTILMLAILVGAAIRQIPDQSARESVANVFRGLHGTLMVITQWLLRWIPLGLFGFMTSCVQTLHAKHSAMGLGEYLSVIVLANLIQGLVILPLWLKWRGFSPYRMMRALLPALSVAFFSKSSVGTLPLTMDTVEQRLNISPEVSRFVLPLCTSINMNGCAAFIFTTVVYMMHNADIALTPLMLLTWILISTLAAIGNAGVPMGCFFLSVSLLVSMNVPINLMGLILPFYALIDMLETALNVWSDCCVVNVVAKQVA